MVMPALGAQDSPIQDPFNREPFQHPALANVDKLSSRQPQDMVQKDKMAKLAIDVGLAEVIRWKPRMVCLAGCGHARVQLGPLLTLVLCAARKS